MASACQYRSSTRMAPGDCADSGGNPQKVGECRISWQCQYQKDLFSSIGSIYNTFGCRQSNPCECLHWNASVLPGFGSHCGQIVAYHSLRSIKSSVPTSRRGPLLSSPRTA
jgi:hypothetical protein